MERYVAIDNVCAWPNLTLLPNGEIIATIFNLPTHGGRVEGNIECWASEDDGRLWQRRGVPLSPLPPGMKRVNHSVGLFPDGALMVIAWGMDVAKEPMEYLPCRVFRSEDNGRAWECIGEVGAVPGISQKHSVVPFGDIVSLPDGSLAASFYAMHKTDKHRCQCYLIFSHDRGATWEDWVEIGMWDHDETAILRLDNGRWVAAARTYNDMHVDLFVSEDKGRTWHWRGPLTQTRQSPAHLLRLADGRILATYGIRNPGSYAGIAARLSDDGEAWGVPAFIFNPGLAGAGDGGYPSSVQVADGTIVTAHYSSGTPTHCRYHMSVMRWRVDQWCTDMRPWRPPCMYCADGGVLMPPPAAPRPDEPPIRSAPLRGS